MPIAVFDIDGTLTDTTEVDVECYEAAVLEVVGIEIPPEWEAFDEVTDAAILARACELQGCPVPDPETEARIAERVGELLRDALSDAPERFLPIPGAPRIFDALEAAGWAVAMATGAWRPSATVKLSAAEIPVDGRPLATSTEHRARRDIIRRAVLDTGGGRTTDVVYVGDGVWDGRAATHLGYGFVGVGSDRRADTLKGVGASAVVPDLAEPDRLIEHLERARPGASGGSPGSLRRVGSEEGPDDE